MNRNRNPMCSLVRRALGLCAAAWLGLTGCSDSGAASRGLVEVRPLDLEELAALEFDPRMNVRGYELVFPRGSAPAEEPDAGVVYGVEIDGVSSGESSSVWFTDGGTEPHRVRLALGWDRWTGDDVRTEFLDGLLTGSELERFREIAPDLGERAVRRVRVKMFTVGGVSSSKLAIPGRSDPVGESAFAGRTAECNETIVLHTWKWTGEQGAGTWALHARVVRKDSP